MALKVWSQDDASASTWNSFFFFFNLFIYFWLRWVFIAAHGLSLVAASRGYSSLWCTGFSLRWFLLLQSKGSRYAGFSNCGAQAQQLWCMGLVAPRHVGSSRTRARTRVPCIGRQILNHCATGEVPTWNSLEMQIPRPLTGPSEPETLRWAQQ